MMNLLLQKPNPISRHRALLRSCALGESPPSMAHSLHAALLKSGLLFFSPLLPGISSAIFHFYAATGSPSSALLAFSDLTAVDRSAADWTALLSSHIRHSLHSNAFHLFRHMLRAAAVRPDEVTLLTALSAAARLVDLVAGESAHLLFVKLGLPFSTPAQNAAMDVYTKCGRMDEARRIFSEEMIAPNMVSWTVLLTGTLRWEGIDAGRKMFDEMPIKSEVSWTVMVSSSVEAGRPRESLSLLAQMVFGGDFPSPTRPLSHVSASSILAACSQAGNLTVGRCVHLQTIKAAAIEEEEDGRHDLLLRTSLLDMYAKCGRIHAAREVFKGMPRRNVVAWNAMLGGLSMHGLTTEALALFARMEEKPDEITFVGVLSACSRSGMVEEGKILFREMSEVHGVIPKVEHFACMVDLLGRSGRLQEAEGLLRKMPCRPNEVVLGSLIASCGLHGNLDLGRSLMKDLVQLDPGNTEYHVLLANLYASRGRHAESEGLWRDVKKKSPEDSRSGGSRSFVEINGVVHQFAAGDRSHQRSAEIYGKLDEITVRLRAAGHVTDAAALQRSRSPVEEREEREEMLIAHSERLAIAFGILATKPRTRLCVFKNLRICNDCHAAIKLIAAIFEREIVVRDRNRFHCFAHGACSCSDYW